MISEKNILQTDFEGKKKSGKEIPDDKKSWTEKNISCGI